MEPEHALEDEVSGDTPAPQVELIDQHLDAAIEPSIGPAPGHRIDLLTARPVAPTLVDENGWRGMRAAAARADETETEASGESEVPYLRMRSPSEASGLATPTPLLDDLTDLAIPMPEPPATPPLPLMEIYAGAHLDPADETGVGLRPLEPRPRRVSLSRPWIASLGVLAFAAGLLTAAAASVIARPVRSAAAATPVAQTTAGSNVPAPAPASPPAVTPIEAAPAEARVTVAAGEAPAAAPAEAVEPVANPGPATAPARPAPSAKSAAAAAGASKLRTRNTGAPARSRTRATKTRPEPRGESAIADDVTEAAPPAENKEAAPAPTSAPSHRRPPDWVDPFAQ